MNKKGNKRLFLYFAWIVSLIATSGSLYFSEIKDFVPCELCWYQRILMYPLTLILGIATYQSDIDVKKFVLPMSFLGIVISLLHYIEQKVPGFGGIKPCVDGVPCSNEYINWLGFITIPFLSLITFILITLLLLFGIKRQK
ncbi:disulfide oxidoreductase [Cytobacillus sp. IB215665]|uniref:disulfide oxidoreductase n=1 Tax=Cytobacillus sp. IB215665 TaxID=3097357 RepID=UPI002A15490E|nr:disulfide oxidoreductase [Cytobacillus sp. IB215665]MDX8367225.1 disulfide oxidoreductase [Cytobacillus sp. IB215665]